jgi:predicted HTH transcriptional regulator
MRTEYAEAIGMTNAESNRIEYKRELDDGFKLEKVVVSFLNYNGGGEILVGVANDGTIFGINDFLIEGSCG